MRTTVRVPEASRALRLVLCPSRVHPRVSKPQPPPIPVLVNKALSARGSQRALSFSKGRAESSPQRWGLCGPQSELPLTPLREVPAALPWSVREALAAWPLAIGASQELSLCGAGSSLQQPQVTRESATGPILCLLSVWAQPLGCSLFLEHSPMSPPLHVHGWDGAVTLTAAATLQVRTNTCAPGPKGWWRGPSPTCPHGHRWV